MAILKMTHPLQAGQDVRRLIEFKAAYTFNADNIPLSDYIPFYHACHIFRIDPPSLMREAEHSGIIHVLILEDAVLMHPAGFQQVLASHYTEHLATHTAKQSSSRRITKAVTKAAAEASSRVIVDVTVK